MSVDKNGGLKKRVLQAGVVGFLQKPFIDQALMGLIKIAFEKIKG
jgi:FixJ family two-component response regulator